MMPRHRIGRDRNEGPIVDVLRSVGALVCPLNARDLPDLLVGHRGRWVLIEIKAPPGARGGTKHNHAELRAGQAEFFAVARGAGLPVEIVRTPREALDVFGIETLEVKR